MKHRIKKIIKRTKSNVYVLHWVLEFSTEWATECSKTVVTLANHKRIRQSTEPIKTRSKHVSSAKREKISASKSRLILTWLLIVARSGASFLANRIAQVCKTNYFSILKCFFLSLQAGLDLLSVGHMLADVVAIIGKLSHEQNAFSVGRRALFSLLCNLN